MRRFVLLALLCGVFAFAATAQNTLFDETVELPEDFTPVEVILPPSPLNLQVLFIGGHDFVQTTATYGYPAGQTLAKQWHDFIGFTPVNPDLEYDAQMLAQYPNFIGWISVNHEEIYRDDRIGDGGGMTTFAVERDPITGQLNVLEQTLEDGRNSKFFNVDFVNTVGETGMNCAGISSVVDGRIWTAEEWFRGGNENINAGAVRSGNFPLRIGAADNQGVRDTADYTISSDIEGFDGVTVKKYQNFNWMVEIDPRQAVAIRKQYNWGRQAFEGGVVAPDNQTIYLGEDSTPGWWTKFVADEPGDFTSGTTYVYKADSDEKWIEIDNTDSEKMLNFKDQAIAAGATMYNRIEWVAVDKETGLVYWCETGRDNPGSRWEGEFNEGATHDPYHIQRAIEQGITANPVEAGPNDPAYWDYYGRIWVYNPGTNENTVLIEGGPFFEESPSTEEYPDKHLSNPDGLNVMYILGQAYLVINEDLNGNSFGRMPAGVANRTCEVYLLDLSIENPTIDDLIRLTAVPAGAEVTGAIATTDGKTLLLNSQHPSPTNPFPWNNSLTFAIHGFDRIISDLDEPEFESSNTFQVYPNPTMRTVYFNQQVDVAIYDANGQRVSVHRNVNELNVSDLAAGVYYLQTAEGEIQKLIVK